VLHFPFENENTKRSGNAEDVAKLEKCFAEYKNCEFRAMTPKEPIERVLSQDRLEEIFSSSAESPSNLQTQKLANPDVLILTILSHGNTDGLIRSDNTGCPDFTTFQVWSALKTNQMLENCVKLIFFGVGNKTSLCINKLINFLIFQPCRGPLLEHHITSSTDIDIVRIGKNSTRVLSEPGEKNFANFFSAIECKISKIYLRYGNLIILQL
jgi:hypothetical protein